MWFISVFLTRSKYESSSNGGDGFLAFWRLQNHNWRLFSSMNHFLVKLICWFPILTIYSPIILQFLFDLISFSNAFFCLFWRVDSSPKSEVRTESARSKLENRLQQKWKFSWNTEKGQLIFKISVVWKSIFQMSPISLLSVKFHH